MVALIIFMACTSLFRASSNLDQVDPPTTYKVSFSLKNRQVEIPDVTLKRKQELPWGQKREAYFFGRGIFIHVCLVWRLRA